MNSQSNRRGLMVASETLTGPKLLEVTRRAEELGYDALWIGETWGRDAFSVLTRLAHHTSRVKLGSSVISIFSRGPGMMAQSIATLDEISEGRAILGLGPSSRTLVESWHGVPFDRPISRIREILPLLRLILSGERVNFEGEFYQMQGLSLGFRPPRQEIPLYLASLSPNHLQLTGELADGWLPTFFAPSRAPKLQSHIERGAALAGRTLDAITFAPWMLTCAADDPETARTLARRHIAFFVAAYGDAYQKLIRRYGFEEEVDRLQELWKTDRKNLTAGVSDALLNAVAIAGTPETCRERFAELHEMGIEAPVVQPPADSPIEIVLGTLEALAPASR